MSAVPPPSDRGPDRPPGGGPSRWLLAVALAGLLVAAALVARPIFAPPAATRATPATSDRAELHGFVLAPAAPAPPVAATTADGRPWRLADQEGQVTALFFGYTTCPDVCPQTLALLAQTKVLLDQGATGRGGDRLAVAMITVDPTRDTPDVLRRYMAGFDPTFIGLDAGHGLQSIADAFGASFTRDLPPAGATRAAQIASHDGPAQDHADGTALDESSDHHGDESAAAVVPGGFAPGSPAYTVAHSGVIFVVDPEGRLRTSYLAPFDPRDLAADVTTLLSGDVTSARRN